MILDFSLLLVRTLVRKMPKPMASKALDFVGVKLLLIALS